MSTERDAEHGTVDRRERFLEILFRITLVLKGADGVLELIGGVLLLFLTPQRMNAVVVFLTQHELGEDPNDPVSNWIVHFSHTLTGSATLFGAVYLLVHGLVKVVLVWAVLKEQLWAYPWMIGFLAVFHRLAGLGAGQALLLGAARADRVRRADRGADRARVPRAAPVAGRQARAGGRGRSARCELGSAALAGKTAAAFLG